MFFQKFFNNISYDIARNNKSRTVVDITTEQRIRDIFKNNSGFYNTYELKDGETADILAHKIFSDPEKHWILLMFNDIINPFYDWPLSQKAFNAHMDNKYPGSAFYLTVVENNSSSSSSQGSESSSSSDAKSTSSSSSTKSSSSSSSSNESYQSSSSSSATESSSSSKSSSSESSSSQNSSSSSQRSSSSSSSSLNSSSSSSNSSSSFSSSSSSDAVYEAFVAGETVDFSSGATGVIHRTDISLRRLEIKSISVSDIAGLDGDVILGRTSGAQATIGRVDTLNRNTLHHFEDANGIWLNPFTHIENYISGVDTYVITNNIYEISVNESKRKIKIPTERTINLIMKELSDATRN